VYFTPDGEIKKWNGRFCVHGDLQEDDFETFAPLVAWATVRLFLVLSLVLEWQTVSVDFASAFVQAPLKDPIWIHLSRGFRSNLGPKTCLRLKKSLYGLAIAPRLWYKHLFEALLHPDFGLTQSTIDPYLLVSSSLIIVTYCDDIGIAAPDEKLIDDFITKLRRKGFSLEKEGSFEEFLGINFERNRSAGTIELTQKGLISKIITEMGLQSCKPNLTPASQLALGRDDDGCCYISALSLGSLGPIFRRGLSGILCDLAERGAGDTKQRECRSLPNVGSDYCLRKNRSIDSAWFFWDLVEMLSGWCQMIWFQCRRLDRGDFVVIH
jgi:hypothetical protein